MGLKVEPLGDRALIVRDLQVPAFQWAAAANAAALPGLIEAVPSYETVGLYIEPARFDQASLSSLQIESVAAFKSHEIPVCYELGEDLHELTTQLGISAEAIIELHSSVEYTCYAIGFCPGFPYLGYLRPELTGTPRRSAPRVRVESGSVAITGKQTGIYPLPRPGGWNIIGRTPLELVNVEDRYFPIVAGDQVRFRRIDAAEFERLKGVRL